MGKPPSKSKGRAQSSTGTVTPPTIIDLTTKSKAGRKKTSYVWEHMKKQEVESAASDPYIYKNKDGKEGAICDVQTTKKKRNPAFLFADRLEVVEPCGLFILSKDGNTSGIIAHLKSTHKIERPDDLEENETLPRVPRQNLFLQSQRSSLMVKKKYSFREITARFLAKKYLPFTLFENEAKLALEWLESYKAETRKEPIQLVSGDTVAQDTVNLAVIFQKQLTEHFASDDVGKVSIGLDCWSAPNRDSYFGVSASWIDEEWVLRRAVVGMEPFNPPHTGTRMADLLKLVLQEYGLEVKDIMTLVCDNASNNKTMVDALVLIGF